jgi:hypothetical protein
MSHVSASVSSGSDFDRLVFSVKLVCVAACKAIQRDIPVARHRPLRNLSLAAVV